MSPLAAFDLLIARFMAGAARRLRLGEGVVMSYRIEAFDRALDMLEAQ